jgi:hypothetical protein
MPAGKGAAEFEITIARFQGQGPRKKKVDRALRDLLGHHPRARNNFIDTLQQRSP